MSQLDVLLDNHPMPSWRPVAWPAMIALGSLLAWSNFSQLEEVAVAEGEVVPVGQVKVIQHLEGGIIEKINFVEGDAVKAGDILVQLNLASSGVNREELQVRLDSQLLVRARLDAEVRGLKEPVFPPGVAQRLPTQHQAQIRSFQARKRQQSSNLSALQNLVRQREQDLKEIEARSKATSNNLKLARERLKMSKDLLSEGLTPKIEHLQLEAEVESLQGDMLSIDPSTRRARAAISETRNRVREERDRFRSEAQVELVGTEQAIGRITELLKEATEQGLRSDVRSPIDGVVKNALYHTIGGVVRPGEAIMEIVPTGGKMVIEAKLNPIDRAYVKKGMSVLVKLSAYDYARYGGLDGRVMVVAADSSTDEQGAPFFKLVVETDKSYLGEAENELPITPGMLATVDVHTGSKSVMEYLVLPVLKLRHEAFRER
ncbi:MAG: HlyD family type I secretion periplasmic adaptor subunit [Rhodospirillales bacterium]